MARPPANMPPAATIRSTSTSPTSSSPEQTNSPSASTTPSIRTSRQTARRPISSSSAASTGTFTSSSPIRSTSRSRGRPNKQASASRCLKFPKQPPSSVRKPMSATLPPARVPAPCSPKSATATASSSPRWRIPAASPLETATALPKPAKPSHNPDSGHPKTRISTRFTASSNRTGASSTA